MEPAPGTSDAEQGLVQRRATMFPTLGFKEVVRVPLGMETRGRPRSNIEGAWSPSMVQD